MDMPYVNNQTVEEAREFIAAYGFDVESEKDLEKLWGYHRKAVTYIQTDLLHNGESIPQALVDQEEIGDICNILIYASTKGHQYQGWACGILKVMHAFAHLDKDLFSFYAKEIQDQILKPIQSQIHDDAVMGTTLGSLMGEGSIHLNRFEVKPFKTTNSSITKLLAKPELVTFSLTDKLGVRFVTKHLIDVFRVLRYLMEKNIVCFPHNISDQSNNTLYPLNLFFEVVESLPRDHELGCEELDKLLYERLEKAAERAEFREKTNIFTSNDYRFIKFITRRLIRVENPDLSFFYPYEVQIVDYETYLKNMSGEASHDKYKERQVRRARARILGFKSGTTEENTLHS